jgi:beta-galactosidase
MSHPAGSNLHFGAAYYPEHWPRDRWPEDIRLMRAAGFTVARMAEFAWSTMEPAPGHFDLDWLGDAIAELAQHGLVSVLGTPTAAPPSWLVQASPDLLAVDENGRRVQFGNRCHYCVTSPDLHAATQRIARAMAERFGKDPNVIGWQLDNEYNRVCYCDRCHFQFQQYLTETFGSLDALNEAWSTKYWSQTYSAWDQIPLPIVPATAMAPIIHNPGLRLEFRRFVTDRYRRFQRLQIDELRPHLSTDVWITHNFMGWFEGLDHYTMTQDLDMASWDWYVGTGHHDYLSSGAAHDLTRGFKRRNFWVMETQVGHTVHTALNSDLQRGEARAMAWHAIAHGADGLLYWQWRMALGGQEQYWGTIVDQAGRTRPIYEEVRQIGQELAQVAPILNGTKVSSDVAILNSYEDRWAIHMHRHHKDFDYVAHLLDYYRPLARRNVSVDIISTDAALDGYRIVIAPALHLLTDERVRRLREFVERGGRLVLTVRSGMKDDRNALLAMRQPGPLAELAGAEVEEYYALLEPIPVFGDRVSGTSKIWAERLAVLDETAHILARYGPSNGWLDGQPALTLHPCGQGLVYVIGAWLDAAAQQVLVDSILRDAGIESLWDAPAGLAVAKRVDERGSEIWILVNHERTERSIPLPWPAEDHLNGEAVEDNLTLPPYGVAVLTRQVRAARPSSGATEPTDAEAVKELGARRLQTM